MAGGTSYRSIYLSWSGMAVWGLGIGGWGRGILAADSGDGEHAAIAGNGDTGDSGEGLAKRFGSAGEGGERGDGAEIGEKSGRIAAPGGDAQQKSVESIAKGIGAKPDGFRIGDGVNDGGGMEAQNRRGGSGPSDGIREAGDTADIDIAHVPERGGNSI